MLRTAGCAGAYGRCAQRLIRHERPQPAGCHRRCHAPMQIPMQMGQPICRPRLTSARCSRRWRPGWLHMQQRVAHLRGPSRAGHTIAGLQHRKARGYAGEFSGVLPLSQSVGTRGRHHLHRGHHQDRTLVQRVGRDNGHAGFRRGTFLSVCVASRTIIWSLVKQVRVGLVPIFHGLHRRTALER